MTFTSSEARIATSALLASLVVLSSPSPSEMTAFTCASPCESIVPMAEAIRSGTPPASPASPRAPSTIMARMVVPLATVVFWHSPPTRVSTAATTCEMLSASCVAPSAETPTTLIRSSRRVVTRAASAWTSDRVVPLSPSKTFSLSERLPERRRVAARLLAACRLRASARDPARLRALLTSPVAIEPAARSRSDAALAASSTTASTVRGRVAVEAAPKTSVTLTATVQFPSGASHDVDGTTLCLPSDVVTPAASAAALCGQYENT